MKNYCITCGADITDKRVDARYCGDKCRKHYKRHGSRLRTQAPMTEQSGQLRQAPAAAPVPYAPARRSARRGEAFSGVFSQVYRKSGNVVEALLGGALAAGGDHITQRLAADQQAASKSQAGTTTEPVETPRLEPLQVKTAADVSDASGGDALDLAEPWASFLGQIEHPLKMLVWGLPGSGKSTFALRLLDALNTKEPTVYVSGEEALSSATLRSRVARTMEQPERTRLIERLPATLDEWKQVVGFQDEPARAIVTDSLSSLGLTPYHFDAEFARFRSAVAEKDWENRMMLYFLRECLSHVWIAHAYKDGSTYRGDATWAHDADLVVKCEAGTATTLKNRFGEAGQALQLF